jgi:hypothetical protein
MAVINEMPSRMRGDVCAIVLKLAPPLVVKAVLHDGQLCPVSKQALLEVLLRLGQIARQQDQYASEARWIENITSLVADRVNVAPSEAGSSSSYDAMMPRPSSMGEFLRSVMMPSVNSLDALCWGGDSARPPNLVFKAAKELSGDAVLEIECGEERSESLDPSRVRGAWQIGSDRLPTGLFVPNPNYRPTPRSVVNVEKA